MAPGVRQALFRMGPTIGWSSPHGAPAASSDRRGGARYGVPVHTGVAGKRCVHAYGWGAGLLWPAWGSGGRDPISPSPTRLGHLGHARARRRCGQRGIVRAPPRSGPRDGGHQSHRGPRVGSVLITDIGVLVRIRFDAAPGSFRGDASQDLGYVAGGEPRAASVIRIWGELDQPSHGPHAGGDGAIRAAVDIPLDVYIESPPEVGGFIRYPELPDIIRVAAPVYVKSASTTPPCLPGRQAPRRPARGPEPGAGSPARLRSTCWSGRVPGGHLQSCGARAGRSGGRVQPGRTREVVAGR